MARDCHLKKIKEKRTGGTYLSSYHKYVGKELFTRMKCRADREIFISFCSPCVDTCISH